jgi:Uma2 family endonuclease
MTENKLLTAAEYADQKLDLPENGRWTELVAGQIVTYSPPDDDHGNVVLNLVLAFSKFAHKTGRGYACFDIGLIVRRAPDTVRCPPACFFLDGERFAEIDNLIAITRPTVVVEIASTNDRRTKMEVKVEQYLELGVRLVWVIDPHEKQVHVFEPNRISKRYNETKTLYGGAAFEGFETPVADLFALPSWWEQRASKNGKSHDAGGPGTEKV